MPLLAGDKLGPYEILAPLGAGGMGEVYQARDARLNRVVALKVATGEFSERMEREAKAIAALNHPNICQIYDVGPNYIVMEHIEGAPLPSPLPLEKALEYAVQIASALDAAHTKKITHRDLKPANILVTKQGVKLLDFGLAKVEKAMAAGQDTMTMGLTVKGQILGTVLYMSPEQFHGEEADPRSDIFSFGVVLYEMLMGERPFSGATAASVMGAILERPAPALSRDAPPALQRLVNRCLEKDPENRWQSARDLQHMLEELAAHPRLSLSPAARVSHKRERLVWGSAIGLLAAVGYYGDSQWHILPPMDSVRLAVSPAGKAVFSRPIDVTAPVPQFAVSPDGHTIVYAAALAGSEPMLWLRPLNQLVAAPAPGTERAVQPFWSPDSRWIGFFAQGKLKKLPAGGGPVQEIAEGIPSPRGGSWGPDGSIIYSDGNSPIYRISENGAPRAVTRLDPGGQEASHRWPHFLPDGKHFLYTIRAGQTAHRGIFVGSLDGTTRKQIARVDSSAIYSERGYLLFVDGDTLMGQTFDTGRLAARGAPFPLGSGVGHSSLGNAAMSASASALAYADGIPQTGSLNWYDRSGRMLGSEGTEADYTDFRLSPDDHSLANSRFDRATGRADIWVRDLTRGSDARVTQESLLNASPVWSPDGKRLIFRSNRAGSIEFFQGGASGAESTAAILPSALQRATGIDSTNLVPTDWSPRGNELLFSAPTKGSVLHLWTLPMTGNPKPTQLSRSNSDELHGNQSPDGSLIAYTSNLSGRFEVYVQAFPLPGQKWTISTDGGYEPRWRADGGELFYLAEDRRLMSVAVLAGPSFGKPKPLFQTRVPLGVSVFRTHYVASRDGQRFLVNTQSDDPPPPITVVLNWTTVAQHKP